MIPAEFKPMLCGKIKNIEDLHKLQYPVLVQPKLDGIRCILIDGIAYSRKLLRIPNRYIRNKLQRDYAMLGAHSDKEDSLSEELNQFKRCQIYDGELIIPNKSFHEIQSAVMSAKGEPEFKFIVFDCLSHVKDSSEYSVRYNRMSSQNLWNYIHQTKVYNVEELLASEKTTINLGFEGIIIRSLHGIYLFGKRPSVINGTLLALKRFVDAEAKIIGFNEMMHNMNDMEYDELGNTKRSKSMSGMMLSGMLGQLHCEVINGEHKGKQILVGSGTGMTHELRRTIWRYKDKYINKIITFSYQQHGQKDLPRILTFKGFREDI
jgi:DNA ligase 1